MIERYTRPEMGVVWSEQNKFAKMLDVEVALAQVQAEKGMIPKKAAKSIASRGAFKVERIKEIEATTKHDVIAFVSNVAEKVGADGRYVHYGLTSSDVLDTALSLQISEAVGVLESSIAKLEKGLSKQIRKHAHTLCAGRTHGVHAEPTTFGLKLAGFLVELKRNRQRLKTAAEQIKVGKLSGAVGTYSAQSMDVEKKVCRRLKLKPETLATQVIPRDRHAELMSALALLGCGIERLAVELRHLQRTEVLEVVEGFAKGQKGSSAMPHKKNPISAENLTGVARLLRSYAQAAYEDVALWHERDISHSSVERVIFPDAFILCDYAVERMARLISNMVVDSKRMQDNMKLSQGQLFSSHVLLALVEKGLSREEAYALVQAASHRLQSNQNLYHELLDDKKVMAHLKRKELDQIFSGESHQKNVDRLIQNALDEGKKKR